MKGVKKIYIVLIFILGLSIAFYPLISDQWNKYRANKLIANYDNVVKEIKPDEIKKKIDDARKYNETLIGGVVPDAFSVRNGVKDKEYESLLNINNDGIIGSVEIPSIDVNIPIYHYTTDEVLAKGAGHLFGSSLPVGGESSHTVISAHRGLPSAKLFTDLDQLKEGDLFYFHVCGEIFAYKVDQILVVEPEQTSELAIKEGEDLATLFTCTPYSINSHRLLVRGHRVPYDKKEEIQEKEKVKNVQPYFLIVEIACIIGGILLALILVKLLDFIKKRRKE
ncbi:class C sortase [Clostridium perfringens]|uniref:Class C sortase n=3 Tax=Clostridium perfringens TaxID=1502 RepID=A0A6G4ZC36_CLOPF|nr:class C sortase [Clostridium perfringens]ABG82676.1 sortase family protein [Clostridium perfringens ATCC 13124]EGT4138238.1 class C sortase [Clostridium perfringens]MBI6054664.1 class C sortase [Clostridium perfringens]MCX0411263.1 class C sortase [Clostridium perfringens]MDB2052758.1 class C sortase [Clostridium perfringens]